MNSTCKNKLVDLQFIIAMMEKFWSGKIFLANTISICSDTTEDLSADLPNFSSLFALSVMICQRMV